MKFAKKIHAIICDDIREEKNNKYSLMGMYGKVIIFNELPAILPKICFFIGFEEIKEDFTEIELILKLPKIKNQVFKRQIPTDLSLGSDFNFVMCISPFKALETGDAVLEIRIGDSKRANHIHRFKINKGKTS